MRYKITIFNSRIYKEVIVEDTFEGITVGTGRNCQVQFLAEDFGREFVVSLRNNADALAVSVDNNLSLKNSNGINNASVLKIGEAVTVLAEDTQQELLNIEFGTDFSIVQDNYNYVINIAGQNSISIGGAPGCTIRFFDRELKDGVVTLNKTADGYTIDDNKLEYGVTINGILHKDSNELFKSNHF